MLNWVRDYLYSTDEAGVQRIDLSHIKTYACFLYLMGLLCYCVGLGNTNDVYFENIVLGVALLLFAAFFFVVLYLMISKNKSECFNSIIIAVFLGISNYVVCETTNGCRTIKEYLPFTIISILLYTLLFVVGPILFKIEIVNNGWQVFQTV